MARVGTLRAFMVELRIVGMKYKKRVVVHLTPEDAHLLEEVAARKGLKVSSCLRMMILEWLEAQKAQATTPETPPAPGV